MSSTVTSDGAQPGLSIRAAAMVSSILGSLSVPFSGSESPSSSSSSSSSSPPTPAYKDPRSIPSLTSSAALRKRLSHTRTKQLIAAASRAHDDPPKPPGLNDCCGSACDPCVKTLWREERDAWKERWGDAAVPLGDDGRPLIALDEDADSAQGGPATVANTRMPGSLDW